MKEFFSRPFLFDNTIKDISIALGIIIGAIILGKIIYWFIGKFVKKLTARTKGKLDDLIVDMVEEPAVFAVIIGGLYVAFGRLSFPENTENFIFHVIGVMVVVCVAWLITRLFDAIIEEYLVPLVQKTDSDLDDQLLPIVRKMIKIAVWVIAIIVALNNAGYDVGALLAGLGIGGLAFALAAQDTVSNLFGGFTIFTDKPFQVGDRVIANGYDGFVREIGVRSTRIETLSGRMVTIPNSAIANNAIENITSEPKRKIAITLGLTYDHSHDQMQQAMTILKEIAQANPMVDSECVAVFDSFGDFSLNILFVYFIEKEGDIFQVTNDMNLTILERFTKAGLDFAFPTQTILHKELKN